MFDWKLICIMGGGLFMNEARDSLFLTAVGMIRERCVKRTVRTDECEGIVRTDFASVSFFGVAGTSFRADLETSSGKRTVRFLVSIEEEALDEIEDALANGDAFWMRRDRRQTENAHLN